MLSGSSPVSCPRSLDFSFNNIEFKELKSFAFDPKVSILSVNVGQVRPIGHIRVATNGAWRGFLKFWLDLCYTLIIYGITEVDCSLAHT